MDCLAVDSALSADAASVRITVGYERYPWRDFIGEYLALALEKENDFRSAETLRRWSRSEGAMSAQARVSACASKI